MSNVLIQSSTLTGIADAIRAKDGSTAQMYPSEMAEKIASISTGDKRLIPTSITKYYDPSSSKTISGKGIIDVFYKSTYMKNIQVDGQNISNIIDLTNIADYSHFNIRIPFNFSCKAYQWTYSVVMLGNFSDEILEGAPKKVIIGTDTITVNGKGYIILRCSSNLDYLTGKIVIDGITVCNSFVINNGESFRFDFDKSITFNQASKVYNNFTLAQYQIYTY